MRWIIFLVLIAFSFNDVLISQQLLTIEAGTNMMVLHTKSIDDEYKFVDLSELSGFAIGATLKLNKMNKVDGKVLVNYTNSSFHVNSEYDEEFARFGNSDLDVAINALRFAYMIDYTTGRKTQFFLNAGPAFTWLFRVNMDGVQNTTELSGIEQNLYTKTFSGAQQSVISRGVFSLYAKSGFNIPLNHKMSMQVSAQLVYDLNNHTRDYLELAVNSRLNNLLYLNFMAGLTYDVGEILTDEDWQQDW